MAYFRFTLFNSLTLLLVLMTLAVLHVRWRGKRRSRWPLAYWVLAIGYAMAFKYGLNPYWVMGGTASALLLALRPHWRWAKWTETAALAYVLWRCVMLLLMR